jgi:hypothetical protein
MYKLSSDEKQRKKEREQRQRNRRSLEKRLKELHRVDIAKFENQDFKKYLMDKHNWNFAN